MKQDNSFTKEEKKDMTSVIDFTKYGTSNTEYTLEELKEIYKKITKDIQDGKA